MTSSTKKILSSRKHFSHFNGVVVNIEILNDSPLKRSFIRGITVNTDCSKKAHRVTNENRMKIIRPITDPILLSFISWSAQMKRIGDRIRTLFSFSQIQTKNPTGRTFIIETRFFTCWTMTSEKCTRVHMQENKSIYLSIYLSI